MKKVVDISELVNVTQGKKGRREVHASATANYEEGDQTLVVELKCWATLHRHGQGEKKVRLPSLPQDQIVKERVDSEEVFDAAKEIFRSWIRRVLKSLAGTESTPRLEGSLP